VLRARGIPELVELVGAVEVAAVGLGVGGGAMALPIRDFGRFLALTSPPFSRASNLLAKKLAVFAKVLMSSMA
jgi:hypothetical protein